MKVGYRGECILRTKRKGHTLVAELDLDRDGRRKCATGCGEMASNLSWTAHWAILLAVAVIGAVYPLSCAIQKHGGEACDSLLAAC